jgi:hypothetical protein
MSKVRNAVIIIILSIIGGYSLNKYKHSHLGLSAVPPQEFRDAVAASSSHSKNKLTLNPDGDEHLRDALAESPAIPTGNGFGPHGNGGDGTPPPPRGDGNGGLGNGPNSLPPTPIMSSSGPQ